MYGIRKVKYHTLILHKKPFPGNGPTISGLSRGMWMFKTIEEAEEEIRQIQAWYNEHRLLLAPQEYFEPFELTQDDLNEVLVNALKYKS
jgi:hypothetical protein